MPGNISVPPHLIQFVGSSTNFLETASEALEEWIWHRRSKGDTLFEVSVGLAELEDRTPPHCNPVFARARYTTNVPPPSDLTPPVGPFPLSRSASPVTILHHLLSQPPPSLEHSREVILEYVLSRESKLREKKPGRGGKGTLGREGFEEIASKLSEVEEGLRLPGIDNLELSQNRQLGLALILSLRMSLSYFNLQELGNQLLKLATPDAERVIVQHVRKRVPGEGRYRIGKELEYLEDMTTRRPALRPAFRSAKARTTLPDRPLYLIPLPAPAKSSCIKLIGNFIKDTETGSISSPGIGQTNTDKSYFSSPRNGSANTTPATPFTPLPSDGASRRQPISDPNPIANYVLELVSEYITREKREYMLKSKWAIKGRDSLSKDLGEIETAVCMAKNGASAHAAELIPTFLVLRRSFNLPKSTLPTAIIEPYLDILPAPPDPDDVPYREPSVANITARLYVNPRLDDIAAYEVLEELIDSERENVEASGAGEVERAEWLSGLIDQIEKRFPDGSYEAVFARVKASIANPVQRTEEATLNPPRPQKQPSVHRRALSTAASGNLNDMDEGDRLPLPQSLERRLSHNRSASLPSRKATFEDVGDIVELASDFSDEDLAPTPIPGATAQRPILPALNTDNQPFSANFLSPRSVSADRSSMASASAGWWDVVSAVDGEKRDSLPWRASRQSSDLTLPPGAEPARAPEMSSPLDELNQLDLDLTATPRSPERPPMPIPQSSPARRAMQQVVDGSPRSIGSDGSPRSAVPSPRPPPVPINFDRPSFPSPSNTATAADKSPPLPVKSKLGTFGRSLSIASKSMLARSKEKEKEKEKEEREREREAIPENKENERVNGLIAGKRDKDKVQNNPGKWNKDMVASIMGQPVDRKT